MVHAPSLLQELREVTAVDCDTLDPEVARKFGPFVDCTSNQAIAFAELSKRHANGKLVYDELIKQSYHDAQNRQGVLGEDVDISSTTGEREIAVEIMMVRLALKMKGSHLKGYVHVQTNPRWSYDTLKTIQNAKRIVTLFKHIAPQYGHSPNSPVCIKIPATWEGLQACRLLELQGITTLATTMFCMEQAALAEAVGCTYIAPYVNELKVHFDHGYVDPSPAFTFCGTVHQYYRSINAKTKVLPASLTSIRDVLLLAGVDHITIAPKLLQELMETPAKGFEDQDAIGAVVRAAKDLNPISKAVFQPILEDEGAWRLAFSRSEMGSSESKIIQAVNIFTMMQEQLEVLACAHQ